MYFISDIQNQRPYMEDTHVVCKFPNNISLFGVFDGHGGNDIAHLCKNNVCHIIQQFIQSGSHDLSIVIRNTFKILDILAEYANKPYIGCTALVCLKTNDRLWFANAGDSMAMVCFSDDSYSMMSFEHKVENEKKRIEDSGGFVTYWDGCARVNGTLNVARSIGDHYIKNFVISDPFVKTVNFIQHPFKYIIMASDGIWDVYSAKTLKHDFDTNFIWRLNLGESKEVAIKNTLHNLVRNAIQKGSTDNITIMYIDNDKD